jgi:hypothetical protein
VDADGLISAPPLWRGHGVSFCWSSHDFIPDS